MPPRKTPLSPVVLSLYTICVAPTHYPGRFVVCCHKVAEHGHARYTEIIGDYATLNEARASLPPWVSNTGRGEGDDESIVETWV